MWREKLILQCTPFTPRLTLILFRLPLFLAVTVLPIFANSLGSSWGFFLLINYCPVTLTCTYVEGEEHGYSLSELSIDEKKRLEGGWKKCVLWGWSNLCSSECEICWPVRMAKISLPIRGDVEQDFEHFWHFIFQVRKKSHLDIFSCSQDERVSGDTQTFFLFPSLSKIPAFHTTFFFEPRIICGPSS